MRSLFFPARAREATPDQLVLTGAAGGYGVDPIDGDVGYRLAGAGKREIPSWVNDKARAYSIAAYRMNPMARAIIDTYVSFCVGDSGVSLQCASDQVRPIAEAFWNDPRVDLGHIQDALLRDFMLNGELAYEMMVGETTGVVQLSPVDPSRISGVTLDRGNPLWPAELHISAADGGTRPYSVVQVDDITGLRTGQFFFRTGWRALITDRRGQPFLAPILDELDSYDRVLNNLIDRTALARYLAFEVTVKAGSDANAVKNFIAERGGTHVPQSGTVEVHNESVEWKALNAQSGAFEDSETLTSILTNIAGGSGLAKTWLADPSNSNRATSMTMAEPVRRRVSGVQAAWLNHMTDLARFAVDQAVRADRLPAMVTSTDSSSGATTQVPAAQTVRVAGPEIAASDAQVTAQVILNLANGLQAGVTAGIITKEAAGLAVQKAWEQFVGSPFRHDLALPADDGTDETDDGQGEESDAAAEARKRKFRRVG
jgi:hypothetical protein